MLLRITASYCNLACANQQLVAKITQLSCCWGCCTITFCISSAICSHMFACASICASEDHSILMQPSLHKSTACSKNYTTKLLLRVLHNYLLHIFGNMQSHICMRMAMRMAMNSEGRTGQMCCGCSAHQSQGLSAADSWAEQLIIVCWCFVSMLICACIGTTLIWALYWSLRTYVVVQVHISDQVCSIIWRSDCWSRTNYDSPTCRSM